MGTKINNTTIIPKLKVYNSKIQNGQHIWNNTKNCKKALPLKTSCARLIMLWSLKAFKGELESGNECLIAHFDLSVLFIFYLRQVASISSKIITAQSLAFKETRTD